MRVTRFVCILIFTILSVRICLWVIGRLVQFMLEVFAMLRFSVQRFVLRFALTSCYALRYGRAVIIVLAIHLKFAYNRDQTKGSSLLCNNGFVAKKGQIVDASIVSAPRQHNSRDENEQIKKDIAPDDWTENKKRQKDTDARWMRKNGRNFFGYKNHISIDVKHKFVRNYDVTSASVHDSNIFERLLDEKNTGRSVWADSAYYSQEKLRYLREHNFVERISRKGCRNKKLTDADIKSNRLRSKIRCRVEHIFGVQAQRAGNLLLRSIGIVRAKAKIGLRNLAYNIDRYARLMA